MGINRLSIVFYTFYFIYFTFFTFKSFSRRFYPKQLTNKKVTKTITKLKVYKVKVKSL